MHLEFDDHHPETPGLASAISWREGVLLSIIAHLVGVVLLLLGLRIGWFQTAPKPVPAAPDENITFVQSMTPADVRQFSKAGPDLPRPAAQPQPIAPPPPKGDTNEKSDAPPAPDKGRTDVPVEAPTPPAPSSMTYQSGTAPATAGIANSLNHLDRYLQNMNLSAPQGGSIGRDSAIDFDPKGVDFTWWLARFKAEVYAHWIIPLSAQTFSGHVVISFVVHRDGRITDLKVLDPSKIQAFWIAAQSSLTLSHFPPLPAEYPADQMPMVVTFFYNEPIRH